MSIPWLPVFFKNRFLFITSAILGSSDCGSNGLTAYLFCSFVYFSDAFALFLKKIVQNFR